MKGLRRSSAGFPCNPAARRPWTTFVLAGTFAVAVALQCFCAASAEDKKADDKKAEDQPPEKQGDSPDRKAHAAAMRQIAKGLTTTVADGGATREIELIPEPLFRFNDPARNFSDGSIWGFGAKGRPHAILSLSLHPRQDGTLGWLYEMNSLSRLPVESKIPGAQTWSSRKPGLEFKEMADAPQAADKEIGRTRQFRELSSRFAGFEMQLKENAKPDRTELRLIPRPIHRYADPEQGLIDGAIFLMVHATNPEVVMLIELVREGEKTIWKYAFNRIAFAELHVELDKKEVWTQPSLAGIGTSPFDPYWLFFKPIQPGELGDK